MKSIRRRIAIAVLAGLALLWAAGGTAVLLASRSAALARIDAENLDLARQVRSMAREGGRRNRTAEFTGPVDEGLYYQAWTPAGEVLLRSGTLDGRDLPLPDGDGGPVFGTSELASGVTLRHVTTSFGAGHAGGGPGGGAGRPPWAGGGMREPSVITVGRDLAPTRAEQRRLLAGMVAIGLVTGAATCGVVLLALRTGLRPLRELDESIARVDAHSLGVRFHRDALPAELAPVVRRLDELMERLEAGFRREREFSSALAHEMRTPIAELQALTDLAIAWPEERSEEQMHSIREVCGRLHRMVDTLLELARLEGSGGQDIRQAVELRPLLDDLVGKRSGMARQRQLDLHLDWPEGETRRGREDWWRHLLDNLVGNAIEHARPGGRVELQPTPGGLELRNSVDQLEEADVERLFDRFWRADLARSGDRHAGLGLPLARACAEAMGYQLHARLDRGNPAEPVLVMEVTAGSG